jgi:septum formation protein
MRLVLASASPRRAELLTTAGFAFDVVPADVDETPHPAEPPADYALRVARDKALAVRALRGDARPILAADTVVVARSQILGKPADDGEARQMLSVLSGSVHEVLTAVVFLHQGRDLAEVAATRVRFAPLTPEEIDWYVATGEPRGKAGAYAIQGHGARFVEWIEGSWSNVVGLPVAPVYRILKQLGVVCSGLTP